MSNQQPAESRLEIEVGVAPIDIFSRSNILNQEIDKEILFEIVGKSTPQVSRLLNLLWDYSKSQDVTNKDALRLYQDPDRDILRGFGKASLDYLQQYLMRIGLIE